MSIISVHRSDTRGHIKLDWLDSYHSFSFGQYYDPTKMGFGTLRVLNDDTIEGGGGFGMHPHKDMEIITLVLEGELEHQDSMGNSSIIRSGQIQVMSAGTGIYHSEINPNPYKTVKLLQLWIIPDTYSVTPRYQQLPITTTPNLLTLILSPNQGDTTVWIHQQSWFSIGTFDPHKEFSYTLNNKENGLYIFVIDGTFVIDGEVLGKRDAYGISYLSSPLTIQSLQPNSSILIIETP